MTSTTATKIIVGNDGSTDARAAACWGLDEAARTGATVEFCYAEQRPTVAMTDAPGTWFDDDHERAQQAVVDQAIVRAARTQRMTSTAGRRGPFSPAT